MYTLCIPFQCKSNHMSDIQKMKKASSMLDLVHKSKGQLVAPREVLQEIAVLAPEAVETVKDLMLHSKADSVRLKAALEVLALAGVTKETKISISASVEEMDDSAIEEQIKSLLGEAAQTYIDAEVKDVTPKEDLH